MKKLLLSISFLLISILNYSQNSKITYGVQAGLNYSTFYGYDIPKDLRRVLDEKPAFAFLGGINFEYKIKEKASLKLELNYERKSQKSNNTIEIMSIVGPTQIYNYTSKKNYEYLTLPILFKYYFTDKNSLYINGGPFLGYLLKSNLTNDLDKSVAFLANSEETTNQNNRTDFGIAIGVGKTIEINKNNSLHIEIRENLGVTNTSKNKVWDNGEAKTNALSIIIGYSIN